jgi:hypothetical protein
MDAIKAAWPTTKVLFSRAAWLSEPGSFQPDRMDGNNVAWANELNGPLVVGFVQSALNSGARIIDGTELYTQRSLLEFQRVYNWAKTGLADSGGRLLPAPGVSAAAYKAHISVAQAVYDEDVLNNYAHLSASALRDLTTMAMQTSDEYTWLYTEASDWRGSGWPRTPVSQDSLDAVADARVAANR